MNREIFFFVCFVVGLVLTAASFFGGHLHLGHIHLGHVHLGGRGSHGGGSASWLNGFSLSAFLCWFGGTGYLLERVPGFPLLAVLLLAFLAGSTGAAAISLFLTRVLMRNERPLLPEDTDMRGVLARVSNRVPSGGTGEIVFALNVTRRASAARSDETLTLTRGTEVVVLRYSRGIAWVAPFQPDAEPVQLGREMV